MTQHGILSELSELTATSDISDQLRFERAFHFFLLHLLDKPNDSPDIAESVLSSYNSYVSQFQAPHRRRQMAKEFSLLLKLLKGKEDPFLPAADSDPRPAALSLLPESFDFLKQPLAEHSASRPLSRSFVHTLGFYALLGDENIALQERLQRLKALRRSATSPLRKAKSAGVRSVIFSPPSDEESPTKAKSRLRDAARKANEDVADLRAEVDQLRRRLKEVREAAADIDDDAAQQVAAKRKEVEELTEQLDAATAENKRVKQLMDA
jgi:hypothetical protein